MTVVHGCAYKSLYFMSYTSKLLGCKVIIWYRVSSLSHWKRRQTKNRKKVENIELLWKYRKRLNWNGKLWSLRLHDINWRFWYTMKLGSSDISTDREKCWSCRDVSCAEKNARFLNISFATSDISWSVYRAVPYSYAS